MVREGRVMKACYVVEKEKYCDAMRRNRTWILRSVNYRTVLRPACVLLLYANRIANVRQRRKCGDGPTLS